MAKATGTVPGHLDEDVRAIGAGRIDEPEPRDRVGALVVVPPQGLGDRTGVPLGLLQADHVGSRRRDRGHDSLERLAAAIGDLAEITSLEIEIVTAIEDVERHHIEIDTPAVSIRRCAD